MSLIVCPRCSRPADIPDRPQGSFDCSECGAWYLAGGDAITLSISDTEYIRWEDGKAWLYDFRWPSKHARCLGRLSPTASLEHIEALKLLL